MAHAPTQAQIKKLQEIAARAAAKKVESQNKQGKEFVDNGQGVIPESVWKNLPGKQEK